MTKNGFTIVELLIVIVVIGILAAITLVAFGGIRERAENNKTVSAVSQYVKAIKAYKATFGTLPVASYACLGEHTTPTADMCANTTTTASDCFGAGRAFTRVEMQTEM